MKTRLNIQLGVAVGLTVAGMVLLFCGFWVSPAGIIDSSVLVGFGETCTFSGALFGVDYNYKLRIKQKMLDMEKEREEKQNE